MTRTITIYHLNIATSVFTNIADFGNISPHITPRLKKTVLNKIDQQNLDDYHETIHDQSFIISIKKSSEQQYVILIDSNNQRTPEYSLDLELSLREQQAKLFELAKSREISKETLKETLENFCMTISHLIDCERIGIWLFNSDHTLLTAKNIYDNRTQTHAIEGMLKMDEYPTYFNSVKDTRAFAVHDVSTDARVKELYPAYFTSVGGVQSLLDAPIVMSSGIGGVLCCESLEKRVWTELDQTLVGTLADMVAFLYERIHRMEAEERVRELAFIDQLTGLHNQNSFYEYTNEQLKQLEEGVFVYLQLDQFATIQDVLGFECGEEVIKQSASILQSIFPKPSVVARIGFDHFALFLTKENSENLNERLNQLKKPVIIDRQEVYMTYSYGTSSYPEHGMTAKEGLQSAQIALNDGRKYLSRGVAASFSPDMIEVSKSDMQVEMNLRKGLDFDEFMLYYQPQINSQTEQVEGFEALIRWNHPERGIVPPVEFISLAESTGLILPIGEWVIKQAFQQLEKWNDVENDQLTISINISPRHFLHEKLLPFLTMCLSKYEVPAHRLCIEITENVAMEDYASVKKRIEDLTRLGFGVSIDDFGTGFSAFVYLQHFDIHEIKIDRRFIREIVDNPKSFGIVKSIIDLAKSLQIQVVCEGVETKEQMQLLQKLGCKMMQGFYFAKPLPVHQINY